MGSAPASRRRLVPLCAGGAALVLTAVGLFLWLSRRPQAPPCVVLISLDTVRADHLGCYGRDGNPTPHLDRLAAEGVCFQQCTSSVPLTLPSHASVFTGTHSFVHRVHDNGAFFLPDQFETLPERFRSAGYRTAAFISATVLNRGFGLAQGFDEFYDMQDASLPGMQRGDLPPVERSAPQTCDAAIAFLKRTKKPFFLFVHLFDAHDPYEPRSPFRERFPDPYLAEIAGVDEQVGRLLSTLDALNLSSRTLVVVFADHGEGRGEHGEITHGAYLYDSTLQVPLLLRMPDGISAGRRVAAQVRLVDVAPTILDFVDLPALPDAQGVSLMPLVRGEASDLRLSAYSDSFFSLFHYGYAPLRSLRIDGWKYIHAPRPELYHVDEDPPEAHNLAEDQPQRVAAMRARLERILATASQASPGQTLARRDEAADRSLRALGYMDAQPDETQLPQGPGLQPFKADQANPMDHAEDIRDMSEAAAFIERGRPDEAERILRGLLKRVPADVAGPARAYILLGRSLAAQQQDEKAIEAFRAALSQNAHDAGTLTDLGNALVRLKRHDEAAEAYRAATQIKPPLARAFLNLSHVLAVQQQWDEACQIVEEAIRLDPRPAKAHAHYALILLKLGRGAEAYSAIRRAAELEPDNAEYKRALESFHN